MNYWYIVSAIPGAISAIGVIFCVVRGKGISRKILILFTALLCVAAMFCFGGNAILSIFGMGWRCKPFNAMVGLCFALIVPVLMCVICELLCLKDTNPVLIRCGIISISLALIVISISSFLYFQYTSLSDAFTEYDGQTIVYATNGHGSYGSVWRYYIPINDLVHGTEITQDGWHGVRPWDYAS